ncbi:MAG: hypothetical protein AAGC83_07850, partial [Pseudomonadota bacterium]
FGNNWSEWLKGSDTSDVMDGLAGDDVVRGFAGDDTLIGGEGDDTLRGESGDDRLFGGLGADAFRIRASKWGEGDDSIADFQLGQDTLVFVAADMLDADASLAGMAGNSTLLGLDDLDASDDYGLSASEDGDLVITHDTGSVELDGIAYDEKTDSFVELTGLLEIV